MLEKTNLPSLLEALLLAAGKPLTEDELLALFADNERPNKGIIRQALKDLKESCESRGIHLVEIASGYQFQVRPEWTPWVAKLWEEKAPRYSRALLETLALIAYRQPITRGEIEDIRGVSISQSIFKTLLEERDWIRVVGHREVPGRPALYATTKHFLDYFGLKSLEDLPSLPDIMNIEDLPAVAEENIEQLLQQKTLPNIDLVSLSEEIEEIAELPEEPEVAKEKDDEEDSNLDHKDHNDRKKHKPSSEQMKKLKFSNAEEGLHKLELSNADIEY